MPIFVPMKIEDIIIRLAILNILLFTIGTLLSLFNLVKFLFTGFYSFTGLAISIISLALFPIIFLGGELVWNIVNGKK
tara:strand:+ start:196 stop:429 length:234 start_codon:yes stop_codon:yes gene_type:complete